MTEVTLEKGREETSGYAQRDLRAVQCDREGRNGLFPGSALRWALSAMLHACPLLQSQVSVTEYCVAWETGGAAGSEELAECPGVWERAPRSC